MCRYHKPYLLINALEAKPEIISLQLRFLSSNGTINSKLLILP
jgi:hypothetical protein